MRRFAAVLAIGLGVIFVGSALLPGDAEASVDAQDQQEMVVVFESYSRNR